MKGGATKSRREDRPVVTWSKTETLSHTHMHTQTDSCRFAPAAFKAVMTGQRVIRDSE